MKCRDYAIVGSLTVLVLLAMYGLAWTGMHAFDQDDIFWPYRWLGLLD